jgi:hypothetical protein
MKILFFMSHAGGTRNFESTLRGLAERGHAVHLAFDRMEKKNLPGLWDLANALLDEYPLLTSGEAPRPRDIDSDVSSRLRASLDYMRYLDPEFADAPKLRRRAATWAPPRVRERYEGSSRLARRIIRRSIGAAERRLPVSGDVLDYLREQAPDAVLVTPLLEPGSLQAEYLRGAKQLGIPTCLCVHSWDNLTNKGLIHDVPDAITVWNEMQREEAIALHHVPAERVVTTGAAVYDHWYGWRPSRTREEFAAEAGIDSTRPFVLYVGSSGFIAPDEAGFIVEWLSGLRDQGLDDLQVLARPHPVNPLIGAEPSKADLAALANVTIYPRAGANPTDEESRNDYFDSIYYSAAVAGVNTSAFLEAGLLGRPVVTMLAPRYDETQKGQVHFHHLLNAGGGLLYAADTYAEHAADIRRALAVRRPHERVDPRSARFTAAFIRPHGLDEPAAPRMVATIESLPERHRSASGHRINATDRVLGALVARAARTAVEKAQEQAREIKRAKAAEAAAVKAARRKDRAAAGATSEGLTPSGAGGAAVTEPGKSRKLAREDRPPKGPKLPRDERPVKVPKPPREDRPPKAPRADKAPTPAKEPKAAKPRKEPKAAKPPKEPKAAKPPKAPKAPKAVKAAKALGAAKPPKEPGTKPPKVPKPANALREPQSDQTPAHVDPVGTAEVESAPTKPATQTLPAQSDAAEPVKPSPAPAAAQAVADAVHPPAPRAS